MKTSPEETPLPETETMYTKLNGEYYPRDDSGFTVINPASSSTALG